MTPPPYSLTLHPQPRVNYGCQSVTNFNTCLTAPSLTITAPSIFSATNGHATNTSTAQVTTQPGLAAAIIILCDGTYEATNLDVPITILSNWNIVTWNGVSHTNLNTLTWTLPFTNGGIGTNTFYVKYSDASPCGGVFTNSLTATFAVASWITALPNSGDAFGPGIDSSPALSHDGSTVYIESTSNFVYAINVTNGALIWSNLLAVDNGEFTSSPTVASNGVVFAGSTVGLLGPTDGFLNAYLSTGSAEWSDDVGAGCAVFSTPAVTPSGAVYVGTDEANEADVSGTGFYSFLSSGARNWLFTPQDLIYGNNGDVESSAAIAVDGSIYFISEGSRLYALDPNGNVKWFLPVAGHTEPDSSPAIGSDGTIYVGSGSPYFYAVNPDGSIKWTFHSLEQTNNEGADVSVIYSSPAIGPDATVYFGIGSSFAADGNSHAVIRPFAGIVYAISNGVQKWAYTNAQGEIASSAVLSSDGTVYIGARIDINPSIPFAPTNGLLLAITNGVEKWAVRLAAEVVSSPLITSNGTIIFGCEDGNIYAIPTSSPLASNAPWPMFHHDTQHTGCVATNPTTAPHAVPFPNDGFLDLGDTPTQFSFQIVGPTNSHWSVYASTNLLGLTNKATLLETTNLGPTGQISIVDTDLASASSKFYYLSNNGYCSRVTGYITFTLATNNNLISYPFIEVNDTNYDNGLSFFAPMNTIGSLSKQSGRMPALPPATTVSAWTGQNFITDTNDPGGSGTWSPNGDMLLSPGIGVLVFNPSSSPSPQWFAGVVRPSVTNQIPVGTNFLASTLPIAGGLTSVLGYTNMSYGDKIILWETNTSTYQTNIWTTNWSPSEPNLGLCQGFIMISTSPHMWVQSFSPTN